MHIVYAGQKAPPSYSKSIFLVGPTPRSKETPSWRPGMISHLKHAGYDGVVFTPEPCNGEWQGNYDNQVEWEKLNLERADLILAWVPRDLKDMPAFTTNVEFGKYVSSGKLLYGRPIDAPKCRYLDWLYQDHGYEKPHACMLDMADEAVMRLGDGALRSAGERFVPLHIWNTPMFQKWHLAQKDVVLEEAKVLWSHVIPKTKSVFAFSLWIKLWLKEENRLKSEFILSRSDLSCVVAFWRAPDLLDSKIVFIKEFRLPVRNSRGVVCELPGGSSFKGEIDPLELAQAEFFEETGLQISADRFFQVKSRQVVSTFSTHHAALFAIELTQEEIFQAEKLQEKYSVFGVAEDTERTRLSVRTLRDALLTDDIDWSMIGMVMSGLNHESRS